jgi:hypothetical protein
MLGFALSVSRETAPVLELVHVSRETAARWMEARRSGEIPTALATSAPNRRRPNLKHVRRIILVLPLQHRPTTVIGS